MSATPTWVVFGDSLTLGVNDDQMPGGWVSRLAVLGSEAGLYAIPRATFYNLGARRQGTADVARRWRAELEARRIPGMEPRLVFCVGVVDMAAPGGGTPRACAEALADLRPMLAAAMALAPTLAVSPPPVADAAARQRLAALGLGQQKICADLGLPFANIYPALAADAT
jgi:lysophospholipase L1-like esterase